MSRLAQGEEESSITPPCYAVSKRASLSHPADGYDANKLLEQKGQD